MRRQPSSREARPEGVARVAPIDPVEHVRQLRRRDPDDAVGRRRPEEAALLQPLGVERHAQPVVPKDLDEVASGAPEDVQIARVRVPGRAPLGPAEPSRSFPDACRSVRPRARPGRPTARGSSPPQELEHARQRGRVHVRADDHPFAACQHDLHAAVRRGGDGRRRLRMIAAGTNVTALDAAVEAGAAWRRQVNSMLAFMSCRRATIDTDAPSSSVSATIRRLSSADQSRRRQRSAVPGSCSESFNDRVHHHRGHDHRVITLSINLRRPLSAVQAAQTGGRPRRWCARGRCRPVRRGAARRRSRSAAGRGRAPRRGRCRSRRAVFGVRPR